MAASTAHVELGFEAANKRRTGLGCCNWNVMLRLRHELMNNNRGVVAVDDAHHCCTQRGGDGYCCCCCFADFMMTIEEER